MLDQLIEDLRRDEGCKLKPYLDTANKITIGCGRNLSDVGISNAEADILLTNDISAALADLDRAFPWWRGLSAGRQRGLANLAFNLGITRLSGFVNMLAGLKSGDYPRAHDETLNSAYAKQVGARATRIAQLFLEG